MALQEQAADELGASVEVVSEHRPLCLIGTPVDEGGSRCSEAGRPEDRPAAHCLAAGAAERVALGLTPRLEHSGLILGRSLLSRVEFHTPLLPSIHHHPLWRAAGAPKLSSSGSSVQGRPQQCSVSRPGAAGPQQVASAGTPSRSCKQGPWRAEVRREHLLLGSWGICCIARKHHSGAVLAGI